MSAALDIPTIHVDDRLLVFDKPAGLLTAPGIGPEKHDSLSTRIAAAYPEAKVVHRLDQDTSGVIVLALDPEAHRELSRQFHDREVRKTYIAVVEGVVESDEGVIDEPIAKDESHPPRQKVCEENGRSSVTHWRVLDRDDASTRLELRPHTGRRHQLRVHMQWLGHPILGDTLYAAKETQRRADRLLLHAASLWLVHPSDGSPKLFESPSPF